MKLRAIPTPGRDGDKLRDIYSSASDIPVAIRVHHTAADEIVRRYNAFDALVAGLGEVIGLQFEGCPDTPALDAALRSYL